MPLVSDKHSNGRFATRPYAEAGSCIGLLEDQEGTFGLGVSQEALDITVLTGCSVQLLFVDDDPLQENNITDVNKNTLIFCNRYFI